MSKAKRPKLDDGSELEAINVDSDTDGEVNEMEKLNQTEKELEGRGIVEHNWAELDESTDGKIQEQSIEMQNGEKVDAQKHNDNQPNSEQATDENDTSNGETIENHGVETLSTLHRDFLDEILKLLPSIDVKSVGQTCKALKEKAADHFQRKYPGKKLKIRMPLTYQKPNTTNGFAKYYKNVFIEDADTQIFDYLAENCSQQIDENGRRKLIPLRQIQFGQKTSRKKISKGFGKRIADHLKTVESIEFLGCRIQGDLYKLILQFCESLKRLSIRNYAHEGVFIGENDNWLQKKYRSLEHLALVKTETSIEQLNDFFRKNRRIKSFTTTAAILMMNKRVFFRNDSIDLNELNIELKLDDQKNVKAIARFLNKLYDVDHFKHLTLRMIDASILTDHIEDISAMKGLIGIYFDCEVVINEEFTAALASLTQLEILYIRRPVEATSDKGSLRNGTPNISAFYIQTVKADLLTEQILPVIQQSPKLRKISIRKINGDVHFKLNQIHQNRMQLVDGVKVKILLDEATFLKIQSNYLHINLQTVEVKRVESDLTWHPYALHEE